MEEEEEEEEEAEEVLRLQLEFAMDNNVAQQVINDSARAGEKPEEHILCTEHFFRGFLGPTKLSESCDHEPSV